MFHYYSVQHRQFLWINGSTLNQMETVEPEVTFMDFGFDGYVQCVAVIRNKFFIMCVTGGKIHQFQYCDLCSSF